ncbi:MULTISPECIES: hypothetical protein [Priestia]|uniref:hypothetical protein n=1 Tax=Priestia TaxID=2800373 RepID=UPI001C8EBBE9|nr:MULTISPECIES: hypothetical protein [Priestia]MBX9985525.1 hypothetical protein [Priestia aryabhattai]UYV55652.1 hypothetical protein OHU65_26940 [Priestia megaterium]
MILLTSKKSKCKKHKKTCLKKSTCTKCQQKCLKKCLEKCKKKSPKHYHTIKISVPEPAGISDLPKYIYFQIDNSFTDKQEQRIKTAISAVLSLWYNHHKQKWNGGKNTGISDLAACIKPYATKNFDPIWAKSPLPNAIAAINLAMNQFTQLIRDNGFRKSPPAIIDTRSSTTIYALVGKTKRRIPLSFQINPKQLDNSELANLKLTGSMFHAWLHHAGWRDPKTTSYFISECPMCVARNFKPKRPDVRDSSFYKFFD